MTLQHLEKALKTLNKGYKKNPSELERDGLIQRFEYCLELCWKSSKKILFEKGIEIDVPKNIFRELANIGWIDNPAVWLNFIDKRNKASHIYNENVAKEIFDVIPSFLTESEKLFNLLKTKL